MHVEHKKLVFLIFYINGNSVQHMLKILQPGLFSSLDICDTETWGCWNVIPIAFWLLSTC